MKNFFILSCSFFMFCSGCAPESTSVETVSSYTDTLRVLADTNQYLYDFLHMVINDQKLQYSYGVSLQVEPTLSHGDDEAYLANFIKTNSSPNLKQQERLRYKDSIQKISTVDSAILINAAEPFGFMPPATQFCAQLECLTKKDLAYMLDEKSRLKNFTWNNQRLGFNRSNGDNWYVFSLPYFSEDRKTAFISIRSLCKPFLCGSGYILLYRFENNAWVSTQVNSWIH